MKFYWVKINGEWQPARKDEDIAETWSWDILGSDQGFSQSTFDEVGPEILPPDVVEGAVQE